VKFFRKKRSNYDRRLRRSLYSYPPKKRKGAVDSFFSHPSWQAVGAIISLLSLIVTIILTFYIFQLTNQQETANVTYDVSRYETASPSGSRLISRIYFVSNNGPAVAQDVNVLMISTAPVKCEALSIGPSMLPSRTEHSAYACQFFFDRLYDGRYAAVRVTQELPKSMTSPEDPPHASISGINVSTPINSVDP
jgi:hypothetical protein